MASTSSNGGKSGYPAVVVPEDVTLAEMQAFREELSPAVREEAWLVVLLAALTSAHHGAETIIALYTLALSEARSSSASVEARAKELQRLIQETMVKGSVIFGTPPALDVTFTLLAHIRSTNPSHLVTDHFSRSHLLDLPLSAFRDRAEPALRRVYRHNLDEILEHKMGNNMHDLRMLTLDINYGLNLADESTLDWRHTQLVVLAALVAQNCRAEVLWHMRGALRAGWSHKDVESVRSVCIDIASRLGRRTDHVPPLSQVSEHSND